MESLVVIEKAYVENDLLTAQYGVAYQFLRKGYYVLDSVYSSGNKLVFNRTVTLKDTWAKEAKKS
jgi:glutaminyl-tRNA synthetase